MLGVTTTSLNSIGRLRKIYLSSLPVFQDLYIELMLNNSSFYFLFSNDKKAGYIIVNENNILIEFFVSKAFIHKSQLFFDFVITELEITKILCKSFDNILLNSCLSNSYKYKTEGYLFRNYLPTKNNTEHVFEIRFADVEDFKRLLKQKDGLYESPEELYKNIEEKTILIFSRDETIYGCGYLTRVNPEFSFFDIGMWVSPRYRNKGIATFIISYLKSYCISNNMSPICGCDSKNYPSRKVLEKNGFYSQYKLLSFSVKPHKQIVDNFILLK